LLAARRNKDRVETDELNEAVERVVAGPQRRSRLIGPKERQVIAYHESGHALVALSLPFTDPVHKISIVPRGIAALGYTLQMPTEDKYITTQVELENRISALMGGRIAEKLVFGHVSTGAQNDLEKVSHLARRMVCEFGMTEALGPVSYGKKEGQVFLGKDLGHEKNYSELTAQKIDEEVHTIVHRSMDIALRILTDRRRDLDALASALLEREVLEGSDLPAILGQTVAPDTGQETGTAQR
ncbi:MAG: cell division protein FtsH, partial [Candidatus Riflebacteria bacterium]|nr:cell division protein FtsH [Candidatus Riflebacteria bacterium]